MGSFAGKLTYSSLLLIGVLPEHPSLESDGSQVFDADHVALAIHLWKQMPHAEPTTTVVTQNAPIFAGQKNDSTVRTAEIDFANLAAP